MRNISYLPFKCSKILIEESDEMTMIEIYLATSPPNSADTERRIISLPTNRNIEVLGQDIRTCLNGRQVLSTLSGLDRYNIKNKFYMYQINF